MRPAIQVSTSALALMIAMFAVSFGLAKPASALQEATPDITWSCDDMSTNATPGVDHSGMEMGTPASGEMDMDDVAMDLDQMYIDMMIPHHASIIALAQAALPELTDQRLIAIAENIIATQSTEIDELRDYRDELYGSSEPMPMDEHMMSMMMEMMPGMGTMEEMAFQMDAEAQVLAFCGADNPDLTFIDMVIPHHEMAIVASEAEVENGTQPDIMTFAQRVITDQQAEIDELESIREDLEG